MFSAFGTFLMRQFFMSMPAELEEAARLDGANPWQIFWRVMLPLAKPGIIALAVFTVLWSWNDLLWPLVVDDRSVEDAAVGRARPSCVGLHRHRLPGAHGGRAAGDPADADDVRHPAAPVHPGHSLLGDRRDERDSDGRPTTTTVPRGGRPSGWSLDLAGVSTATVSYVFSGRSMAADPASRRHGPAGARGGRAAQLPPQPCGPGDPHRKTGMIQLSLHMLSDPWSLAVAEAVNAASNAARAHDPDPRGR